MILCKNEKIFPRPSWFKGLTWPISSIQILYADVFCCVCEARYRIPSCLADIFCCGRCAVDAVRVIALRCSPPMSHAGHCASIVALQDDWPVSRVGIDSTARHFTQTPLAVSLAGMLASQSRYSFPCCQNFAICVIGNGIFGFLRFT